MPEGEFGLEVTISASVHLLVTDITLFSFSHDFPLAYYDYPCVPQLATLASVRH